MTADVLQVDLDRLRKLCGLFSSHHDGERANAAAMADRLLRQAGLTWDDVLRGPVPEPSPRPAPRDALHDVLAGWPVRWQAAAQLVLSDGVGVVRAQDLEFAAVVAGYAHRPSERQLVYLHALARKVLQHGRN